MILQDIVSEMYYSQDYKCAIDFQNRLLRPPFYSNLADLDLCIWFINGCVQKTGDLITLPYTISCFYYTNTGNYFC